MTDETKVIDLKREWKLVVENSFSGIIQNTGSRDILVFFGVPKGEKGHKLSANEFMRLDSIKRQIHAMSTSTSGGELAITPDESE